MAPRRLALGIDVGTGSARAALVNVENGDFVATHKHPIKLWTPLPDYYEQSSEDIWHACVACARAVMASAAATPGEVCGVGFDATCSLVCLGAEEAPVGVDPTEPGEADRNIILWADHRANSQAKRINDTAHPRLATVGGTISPEMELPKILWLREQMPGVFSRVRRFLDLVDYLTYRAADYREDVRSLCTVVCKWNGIAGMTMCADVSSVESDTVTGIGHDRGFLASIGFADGELPPPAVGSAVAHPGEPIAGGLGATAAAELGLAPGTPLAVGLIDAHAGGIGSLGATLPSQHSGCCTDGIDLTARLALIAGTSACHMVSSTTARLAKGVWGPYLSAMVPGLHLNEGGQSAAGALLDHIMTTHAAYPELQRVAAEAGGGMELSAYLNARLEAMAHAKGCDVARLSATVHVVPDFNGNRSPLADPLMRGAVCGLGLSATLDDLAIQYLAAVQSLAYQTRQILDAIGAPIRAIVACGGLSKNRLYLQTHADVMRLPCHVPAQDEAVLLGAAIIGAVAAGEHDGSMERAMTAMSQIGDSVWPSSDAALAAYHEKKFCVFRRMTEDQLEYRRMMCE